MTSEVIKKYYEKTGASYGINSLRRKKILNLVRTEKNWTTARILDLGCATGVLGKELKTPNNFLAGIDISPVSIGEAKKFYDAAFVLDMENEPLPTALMTQKFDIVICAEIIEHLFDQEAFLLKVQDLLKPEGKVIFSSPNFLLWNNRLRIFLGDYGDKEIFYDRSHIHLLSYNGFKKKLENAGFAVIQEDSVWYPNWLEKYKNLLNPNLFVFQTIIKTRKV